MNGSKMEVYHENQRTWVNAKYDIHFLEKSKRFIINSDQSGWDQYYLYNTGGKMLNEITKGDFSVVNIVQIDEKNEVLYFMATKENKLRTDLYKIGFDGKNMARLTFGDFTHNAILISPHAKYFITTYSNIQTPPKMALVDQKGKLIRILGDSKGTEFDQYVLAKNMLHYVKTRDSLFDLAVLITYPLHFDPSKKYPVFIEVYGGLVWEHLPTNGRMT